MDTPKIYTLGYNDYSFYVFKDLVEELDALVVDIRYSPNSYVPFWKERHLKTVFKENYIHIVELGNKNFNNKEPIEIYDIDVGCNAVIEILEKHHSCILLCACSDLDSCHRKIVAEELEKRTICEVIHL